MGKHYSVYIADEDQANWIDEMSDEVFDGDTALFKKAVELMRKNYEEEIEALRSTEDVGPFT